MKMNKSMFTALVASVICLSTPTIVNAEVTHPKNMKIGVINFKQCVERSKIGKQEQTSFEALKKQAEQILQAKEKEMGEIGRKLEDSEYLDGLSPDAERELKHKFRSLNQELAQQQQQLYQTLSQANFKIVQKLTEDVNEAASTVGEKLSLDLVINDDTLFYSKETLDITDDIIKQMDASIEDNN